MPAVSLSLLGPMELRIDGATVDLGGPRRRAVLARLVLHRGSPIGDDRIIAEVWGPDADAGARRSLQTYVSALRGLLADVNGAITRESGGYRLETGLLEIDIDRFELAAARAVRDADTLAAAEALALWRGEPLHDVAGADWAVPRVTALRELHRRALLVHLDGLLRSGRHEEVLGPVGDVLADAPFDEDLWERRMLALYRSGRHTEALSAFSEIDGRLRDELGLEPGRGLADLQRRILLHDRHLTAPGAPPHEVPEPISAFVGRASELCQLDAVLRDHRLVTISGPGGVGKTRTAVELAHAWRGRVPVGVFFVDLAGITEDAGIAGAIARRLGADAEAGGELAQLGAQLAGGASLLVLDNAEHLRDGVATAARSLLERAPALRVVVTSRIALGISGEVTWQLPPLELPREDDGVDQLADRDAVALFVQRAGEAHPGFQLDTTTSPSVARITRRLDGLPLGIEIAASRLRSMSVAELEQRLAGDLGALRSDDPTAPERHRTLTAVLRWSTDRLPPATTGVLARLAVLPGTFDLTAAAAICRAGERETGDHLDVLVQHSLLHVDAIGARSRYAMLEVVRDHAAELLADAGGREDAERALISWAGDRARDVTAGLASPDEPSWIDRLAADHAALHAALAAALRHDPVSGLRLATRLMRFWWAHAGDPDAPRSRTLPTLHEGIGWLERLLGAADADPRARAGAQIALGFLHEVVGDHSAARAVLVEARDAMDDAGEVRLAGWAALYLANVAWGEGADEAADRYQDAVQRLADARDEEGQGTAAMLEFSYQLRVNGRTAAQEPLRRFLGATETTTAPTAAAYRAGVLALDALAGGDAAGAGGPLLAAIEATRSTSDPATTSILLGICAWYAVATGHAETGALLLAVAERVERRNGLRFKQSEFAREFARDALGGDLDAALEAMARRDADLLSVREAIALVRDLIPGHHLAPLRPS